ncbi:MAG TPA: thioesterase family protein [Solirubrobacteraceae bacterium]|nr:thioesterase family protein [Solirubrobacteraceae bacterium]
MTEPFAHSLRVRYAECDPQGVVFNAHYLAYLDASMTELWRAAFGGYTVMLERGIDMVVVQTELRFHRPARFDELLKLDVAVTRMGHTSISTAHRISQDGELVAEGTLHHVLVDRQTLAKAAIPDWIREGLGRWALEEA